MFALPCLLGECPFQTSRLLLDTPPVCLVYNKGKRYSLKRLKIKTAFDELRLKQQHLKCFRSSGFYEMGLYDFGKLTYTV